ncbi:MAG: helix-hairpin-helix domain-containing protein [Hungatella hathewayi]|nr:helix-hairpin-helix domain-containing protein [Hungatella hathewayi]
MPGSGSYGAVVSGQGQSAKVNLNTASKEQLMTLRGIGESRAEDIIRYREEHGAFGAIEEIMEISGIKDAAFQKIKDDITV